MQNLPSREFQKPGTVDVLTWARLEDSTYSVLYREFAGIFGAKKGNPGHAAFVLNLPDTEENKKIFERLKEVGYPAAEIQEYSTLENEIGKDEEGHPIYHYERGPLKKKDILLDFHPILLDFQDLVKINLYKDEVVPIKHLNKTFILSFSK